MKVSATHFSASLASTIAGWHSAPILKGFSGVPAVKEITLEPQQNCKIQMSVSQPLIFTSAHNFNPVIPRN